MNLEPIYVKLEDVPKTRTRKDFARKFFRGKVIPSYTNLECTRLQCDGKGETLKGSSRSITELHAIICSRFPVTSLKAVVKIVFEIMNEEQAVILVWCNLIQKVVIKYVPNKTAKWMSDHSRERYLNTTGVDGYSLRDFEEIKDEL